MAITATDLLWKLSINTGPGNSTVQGNVNDSLGGFMSSSQLSGTLLNNLFDDVTGDDNVALDVEYRCIFLHNAHATLALQSPKLWISGLRFTSDTADVFTSTAHGLTDGTPVRVEAEKTGDVVPTPLNNTTTYFVRDSAANTFKLAATAGGVAIDLTTTGAGAVRKHGGTDEAIAIDGTGVVTATSASAQAERVANENTAPSGEAFTVPFTKAAGISVPNIPAGSVIGIWIRRTATNSPAFDNDTIYIAVEGDTSA